MNVDDVSDCLKIIIASVCVIMSIISFGFGCFCCIKDLNTSNKVDSVKDKLENENLELENKLLILQLKEYGFDFKEESESREEK